MEIKTYLGGFDKNFSYLIWCPLSKEAAIIDPAVKISPILETIKLNKLKLKKIIITHTHHDHIRYLNDFLNHYPNIKIIAHPNANKHLKQEYIPVNHHENIIIGQEMLITIHTPGHYFDSICIWNLKRKLVFTGDTMFVGRTGRTISKSSNIKDLYESVYFKLLKLPDDTEIYPGHHYGHVQKITLKNNKILSNFFQCKNLKEFINVMSIYENNR